MSFKYGFFDAEGGDGAWDRTYTAEDFTDYLGTMISSGVQRGYENEFAVVNVGTGGSPYFTLNLGKAWIKGRYIVSDSTNGIYYNQEAYEPTGASTYWMCLCAYCNTKDRECGVKFVYLGDEYYRPVDTTTEFYVPLYAVQVNYDGNSYSVLEYNDVREYAVATGQDYYGAGTNYGTIDVDNFTISISDAPAYIVDHSVVVGKNNSVGENSIVIGYRSNAKADCGVAIGYGAFANGTSLASSDIAIGAGAIANGGSSIAIGESVEATNVQSIAIGTPSVSSGSAATAICASEVSGVNSVGIGLTSVSGDRSIVIGYAVSETDNQIILGYFPVEEGLENYKVVIADGTSRNDRHNLLTIDNDGIMEINGSAVNTLMVPKDDYDALVARVEALEAKLGG